MPLFISYVSYSNAGIKGMVDKPADRTSAIGALVEKAGGKLQGAFMTTGQHDGRHLLCGDWLRSPQKENARA